MDLEKDREETARRDGVYCLGRDGWQALRRGTWKGDWLWLSRSTDRQTETQTDRQTGGQTGGQEGTRGGRSRKGHTNGQTDRQTSRQADRQAGDGKTGGQIRSESEN